MLARYVLDALDSHRLIVIMDDATTNTAFIGADPQATDWPSTSNLVESVCCSMYASCCVEEAPEPPHINGDLTYLYRRQFPRPPVQKRTNYRHPLRIPCWRAGRWKSLT